VSDNIINLDSYRNSDEVFDDPEISDLEDPVIIGWIESEDGERELHIVSAVDTVPCLWMIELAQKIVESRPPRVQETE
tara:strand:- start:234 stop:467 length:234 start_codon:yes stop_codon:yes gene_type:complete